MQSSKSFTESYLKKLPLGLSILLVLFAGALVSFAYVAHEVLWEKEEVFDQYIFNALSAHLIRPHLTSLMKGITYFASASFLQIAYAALFLLYFFSKNRKRALEIAGIGIGGFVVNYCMKLSFQRTRPPHPLMDPLQNFSFPSGHATSGFIFYGLLAYLVWKTSIPKVYKYLAVGTLILFSLLIGFSRVYLRMHYPTDVIAGFCIGFAWLLFSIYIMERMKKKTDKEQTHVHS
jgi:membrane-associated phospholipid phosphatase